MTAAQSIQTAESYNVHAEEDTFAPVPNWILKRKEISMGAKAAYGRLCQYGGTHGAIWPKLSTLADELGVSESQAGRYIHELESFNLIQVKRRGLTLSNQYALLAHVWQKQEGAQEPKPQKNPAPPDPAYMPVPDLSYMPDQSYKDKIKKKTTDPAQAKSVVVVSLPDPDDMRKASGALRSDIKATKGIRRTIRQGIAEQGLEHVLKAIEYANQNSTRNYGAYLNLAVNAWDIEDCQPRMKEPAPEPTPEELAWMEEAKRAQEAEEARRQEESEIMDRALKRNRLIWEAMPEGDKAQIRDVFLVNASTFIRKRCQRLSLDDLGRSIHFETWLAKASLLGAQNGTFDELE
jgi:hypothetical protein